MDDGRIPRNNARAVEITEARRSFYVGFTRAEDEVHMVYTSARPSPFVSEVKARLEAKGDP
jgi:DNA helicase-2/ATP-dependent DNA helicase PcrA